MSQLIISKISCWKCGEQMKVCAIKVSDHDHESSMQRTDANGFIYPYTFNNNEISLSINNGVILQHRYSSTSRTSYIACCCPNCNSIFGNHYYFTKFLLHVLEGTLEIETISI